MENQILKQLFMDFVDSDEYCENIDAVAMDKERSKAAQEINTLVGNDLYMAIEASISESECQSEYYGFVMGFKLAMRFATECGICR